jgi:hypothetical protein
MCRICNEYGKYAEYAEYAEYTQPIGVIYKQIWTNNRTIALVGRAYL